MFCHISVAVNLAFGSRCFKGCITFRRFKLHVSRAPRIASRTTRIDSRSARFTEAVILAQIRNDYPVRTRSISWSGFHGLATALWSFAPTPRQKDLMCFWFSFTQISLSVWVWVCELYNSVVSDLSYIAINREFRLHSRRVLPNFFRFVVNRTWKSTGRVLQSRYDSRSTHSPVSSPETSWLRLCSKFTLAAFIVTDVAFSSP